LAQDSFVMATSLPTASRTLVAATWQVSVDIPPFEREYLKAKLPFGAGQGCSGRAILGLHEA
jgi:hypothetical protein